MSTVFLFARQFATIVLSNLTTICRNLTCLPSGMFHIHGAGREYAGLDTHICAITPAASSAATGRGNAPIRERLPTVAPGRGRRRSKRGWRAGKPWRRARMPHAVKRVKTSRACICGCKGASSIVSTGARQASRPAAIAPTRHAYALRRFAKRSRISGQAVRSFWSGSVAVDPHHLRRLA